MEAHGRGMQMLQNFIEACVGVNLLVSQPLFSWRVELQFQAAQTYFTQHHSRRHPTPCANTRSVFDLRPQPLLSTARSTALQRQSVIHSHWSTRRTHVSHRCSRWVGQLTKY